MREFCFSVFGTFLLILLLLNKSRALGPPKEDELKIELLPACAACKVLVESFKKGIERTKKGKFEGGDTAWEEDNLKSYAKSEVRLTDIQEVLCKDVKKGETQCHSLAGEYESLIEDWWFNGQEKYPDLFEYICINQAESCCPKDHYGPKCEKCPNCSNNGKCKGSGTRKGNGKCLCDKGYSGENCLECTKGHYESYRDDDKLLCSTCHRSCVDGCKTGGPESCLGGCKDGWKLVENQGCVDINECLENTKLCSENEFCVNKEGNYSCLSCDRACDGCSGDGPDMCAQCADGYHKKDNICINSDILGRKKHENFARYAAYFGLCISTCIIFQSSVYAASAIGLLVGLYISLSEYILATSGVQNATPNLDLLQPMN